MHTDEITTKCEKCGTKLEHIERPERKTCACGEITAYGGMVYRDRQGDRQTSLFDLPGEYPG